MVHPRRACLVLGGLTLAFFHEDTFLKWKAPLVNWLSGPGLRRQSLHRRQADDPAHHGPCHPAAAGPLRLNIAWVVLPGCGFANLYVVFTYPNFWVDFKVPGSSGMTLLFLIGQGLFLARHLHDADTGEKPKD